MIDELFPTEKDRNEAIGALRSLAKSKGWQILGKLLDREVEKIDNELKTQDFDNLIDLKVKQDQYATRVLMKELPNDIIRALSDEPLEKVELDPYKDRPSKEEAN